MSQHAFRFHRLLPDAVFVVLLLVAGPNGGVAHGQTGKPVITKLGTIDCDLVETTPVVFRGRLYRFEYVRTRYRHNLLGKPYFRLVDVKQGRAGRPFGIGLELGCAFASRDELLCYGVRGWGTDTIYGCVSSDLERWTVWPALRLPGWKIFNTSVTAGDRGYVMAIEISEPRSVAGVPFTVVFARSEDLRHWKLLPTERFSFGVDRYTACPTLRYLDGWYYMTYLERRPGRRYETWLARSRDLTDWQLSPMNPFLSAGEADRRIANPRLTAEEKKRIRSAVNINNSDVDFCEYGGQVYIYYSWGNQRGVEFLAEARYEGSLSKLLAAFFSETGDDGPRRRPDSVP